MLRFQTAVASVLGSLLVIPALTGQGSIATLQDALSGTERAIEILKGIEKRFQEDPAAVLSLVLSATEAPSGSEDQRDQRLEALRSEVNLLQMELDARQSPLTGADGAVQSSLGARGPLEPARPAAQAGVTTGLDDSLRALLTDTTATKRHEMPGTRENSTSDEPERAEPAENAYSADPLRHGITCYRAGRYAEAYQLLAPLEDAIALYWQARTLERLERLDEAVEVMEHSAAKSSAGFEQRRAQTDLEFLRWKRDFVKNLPGSSATQSPGTSSKKASNERKVKP